MARRLRQLDASIRIVTPENIAFEYRVAGPFTRLPAYLIDVVLQTVLTVSGIAGFAYFFGMVGMVEVGFAVGLLVWFVVAWFYGGLFETFWNGQTPGKRMLNLRVVTVEGQPINALQAVLRNILRVIDSMPVAHIWVSPVFPLPIPCYVVGLGACLLSDRYQRLGDMACGTMVIIEDRQRLKGVFRFDSPQVAALAAALPPGFTVGHSLSRALAKYVERRRYFTPNRRSEIAWHLGRVLVEKWNLPPNTNHDLLLCALYHRTFVTDRLEERDVPSGVTADFSSSTSLA